MAQVLDDAGVSAALAGLDGWTVTDGALVRTVQFPDFPAAIGGVAAVAATAEELNHHPDIDIRWRSVTFRCVTHSAGGITDLDVTLALAIDGIAGEVSAV
ncbi:MAG: 4a-hydroxytetrahydrobiopterin dehydratase [Actinomycetota bacterium]|nr:4a-hydroxytetrahydrobiopterin dehydratase [Actinomycetota bacterium]